MKFATWSTLALLALAACSNGKDDATDETDTIETETEDTETGDSFVEVPSIEAFRVFVQGGYVPAPPPDTDAETDTEETETDVEDTDTDVPDTDTDVPDTDTDVPDTDTDVPAAALRANLQPTGTLTDFSIDGDEFQASIGFELGTEDYFFSDGNTDGCTILVVLPEGTTSAPWTDEEDALFGFTFDPETAEFQTDCGDVFAIEEAEAYLEGFVQDIEWRFGLHRNPGDTVGEVIADNDIEDALGLGLATEAFAEPGPTLDNYDDDYGYGFAWDCNEDYEAELDSSDDLVTLNPASLVQDGDLPRSILVGFSYYVYTFN